MNNQSPYMIYGNQEVKIVSSEHPVDIQDINELSTPGEISKLVISKLKEEIKRQLNNTIEEAHVVSSH